MVVKKGAKLKLKPKNVKRIRNICKIIRQDVNVSSYEKRLETRKSELKK